MSLMQLNSEKLRFDQHKFENFIFKLTTEQIIVVGYIIIKIISYGGTRTLSFQHF